MRLTLKLKFILGLLSIFCAAMIFSAIVSQKNYNKMAVVFAHAQYAADFSDDKVLMGASHNVFIGKVLEQVGTKERGIGPETQFEVQVIENIKGDLKGSVVIDQQGGYKNGVLYIVSDDTASQSKSETSYLLHPGSTYLFATRYNPQENWYTLNSYPTARKLISVDSNAAEASLRGISEADTQVQALKAAYPNEVLLDADVKHGNTLNSYRSVQVQKAAAAAATAN